MTLKERWKTLPLWLRGGIVSSIIGVCLQGVGALLIYTPYLNRLWFSLPSLIALPFLILLLPLVALAFAFATDSFSTFGQLLVIIIKILAATTAMYFPIGAIIGAIMGRRAQNKKQNEPS